MWAPFLMCLVLTGIHAYLGIHVLAREVVFVDIALAQIAALGATAAFLWGYELDTWESYVAGARLHRAGRARPRAHAEPRRHVSQEAVIGVVYAVSSAAAVLAGRPHRPTAPSTCAGCSWAHPQRARRRGREGGRPVRGDRRVSLGCAGGRSS